MTIVTTTRAAMPETTANTPLISESVSFDILAGRAGAKHVGNCNNVCFSSSLVYTSKQEINRTLYELIHTQVQHVNLMKAILKFLAK